MKFIEKNEIYNWSPYSIPIYADAEIPDDLHQKLQDALQHYINVCKMIDDYLDEHEEQRFNI